MKNFLYLPTLFYYRDKNKILLADTIVSLFTPFLLKSNLFIRFYPSDLLLVKIQRVHCSDKSLVLSYASSNISMVRVTNADSLHKCDQ